MACAKSSPVREIGVGVIGLGWMGRVHAAAYASAALSGESCRVVAAADRNMDRLRVGADEAGNLAVTRAEAFDFARVRTGSDISLVLDDPSVELVSVCTPTDTHVEIAIAALRAGKHVIVEKPVSLDAGEIERLDQAARNAERLCMPAMCMRFWPGWSWLRDAVVDRRHGRVVSATFQRLGSRPAWGTDFYRNPKRSGGALFDLHVHDVDFVRWLFGDPISTASTGTIDHVTTSYVFENGPAHVVAEGGWDASPGFPFRMRYLVVFETATAEYDSRRDPPLEITRAGAVDKPTLESGTGWDHEVRHALACVRAGKTSAGVTLSDAAAVTRVLRAEEHDVSTGTSRMSSQNRSQRRES
jgi:predicted dehydrogenase